MKNIKSNTLKKTLGSMIAILFTISTFSQSHVTMSLKNIITTTNSIEYDLYIVNDGTTTLKLSACSYGINFNPDILNGGTLTYSYHENSRGIELQGLKPCLLSAEKRPSINQIRMTTTAVPYENAPPLILNKEYKIGHFRIINSVAWKENSQPDLSMQELNQPGYTNTQLVAYSGNDQKLIGMSTALLSVRTEIESSPVLNPSQSTESTTVIPNFQDQNHVMPNSPTGLSNQINLFPNPVTDQLHLNLNGVQSSRIHIKILDFQGRIVKQIFTDIQPGYNQILIDVREFTNGIYSIHVKDDETLSLHQTFSKQ